MNNTYPYKVKSLPYSMISLEPIIDKTTLCIHHDKIYAKYCEKLNLIIKENPSISKYTLEELIYNPYLLPPTILKPFLYNAGGIYNHELYFDNLSRAFNNKPKELFLNKVCETFNTFDNYKEKVLELSLSPVNYHWIITAIDYKGNLKLVGLKDNDTTIPLNLYPVLVIDIAEHAYFIKYHNHKDDYVKSIFNIINYNVVDNRLIEAMKYVK